MRFFTSDTSKWINKSPTMRSVNRHKKRWYRKMWCFYVFGVIKSTCLELSVNLSVGYGFYSFLISLIWERERERREKGRKEERKRDDNGNSAWNHMVALIFCAFSAWSQSNRNTKVDEKSGMKYRRASVRSVCSNQLDSILKRIYRPSHDGRSWLVFAYSILVCSLKIL